MPREENRYRIPLSFNKNNQMDMMLYEKLRAYGRGGNQLIKHLLFQHFFGNTPSTPESTPVEETREDK